VEGFETLCLAVVTEHTCLNTAGEKCVSEGLRFGMLLDFGFQKDAFQKVARVFVAMTGYRANQARISFR